MAGPGIALEVRVDDRQVRSALRRLQRAMGSMRPVMDQIGQQMVTSTVARFEAGVGPTGRRWRPSVRALREGGQTLVDSGGRGGLLGSIRHAAGPDRVVWGSDKEYAAIHQFGGRTPPRTIRPRFGRALRFRGRGGRTVYAAAVQHPGSVIPARPYLGVSRDDRATILRTISRWIERASRGRV